MNFHLGIAQWMEIHSIRGGGCIDLICVGLEKLKIIARKEIKNNTFDRITTKHSLGDAVEQLWKG